MDELSGHMVRHAYQLARDVGARAVVLFPDPLRDDASFRQLFLQIDSPTLFVTRSAKPAWSGSESQVWITVPDIPMTRTGQVKAALLVCLARGLFHRGDRIVFLAGADEVATLDTLLVLNIGDDLPFSPLIQDRTFSGDMAAEVFERVLTLATQLAVEGREGRPVGALFVLGDSEKVLSQSRSLVLNPFQGHPESGRNIMDPALEETIKEFSALDGAFVIRGDGVVLTAGTQLVPIGPYAQLPSGLGTRHAAAASITVSTGAVTVCVSQSTGTVRRCEKITCLIFIWV